MNRVSPDKILSNRDFLNREMPVHLQIDPCGICNLKCGWCFFKGGIDENTDIMRDPELRKHIIDTEKIKEAIEEHSEDIGKTITFVGGGEPLLHPDIEALMYYALSTHNVGLITNLSTTLSKDFISLLDNCDWIRVSLDASTPETYKAIHGVDMFNKVLENMKKISPKTLGISFLVHQDNYQDMFGVFQIAQEVNADYVQFKPVYQNEEELKKLPSVLHIHNIIKYYKGDYQGEILNEYGSRLKILTSKEKYPRILCQLNKYRIQIGSDGEVYPCCIYKYSRQYSYGSIYKQPLIEVLRSNQRKEVDKKLFIDSCPACWDKNTQVKLNEPQIDDPLFV